MKKTKNTKAIRTTATEVDVAHCTAPAQYAMRAECQADCFQMRAVLGRWVTMWREDRCEIERADGKSYPISDVDIVFATSADAPSLEEVRWLLDCLIDCHVGAESLSLANEYTGERADYFDMHGLMRRPSDEVIEEARECARRTKAGLRADFSRVDAAVARLNAELGCNTAQLETRARQIAKLCKNNPAFEECRHDDALALAYGHHYAKLEWLQGWP